jgi:hypothetical protein
MATKKQKIPTLEDSRHAPAPTELGQTVLPPQHFSGNQSYGYEKSPFESRHRKIAHVSLLGHGGTLDWKQDENGLTVKMPPQPPCEHAFALKISGLKLG